MAKAISSISKKWYHHKFPKPAVRAEEIPKEPHDNHLKDTFKKLIQPVEEVSKVLVQEQSTRSLPLDAKSLGQGA